MAEEFSDEDWIKEGIWEGGKLVCPYCKQSFQPKTFSNLSVKQCPQCHRYFLLPREVVIAIVRNPKNTKAVRKYVKELGWLVDDLSDEELRSSIIESIKNEKLLWDIKGWFHVSS